MNSKFLVVSSVTYALKAKNMLESAGIPTRLTRSDDMKASHGCGYGITVSEHDARNAVKQLRSKGLRVIDVVNYKET